MSVRSGTCESRCTFDFFSDDKFIYGQSVNQKRRVSCRDDLRRWRPGLSLIPKLYQHFNQTWMKIIFWLFYAEEGSCQFIGRQDHRDEPQERKFAVRHASDVDWPSEVRLADTYRNSRVLWWRRFVGNRQTDAAFDRLE